MWEKQLCNSLYLSDLRLASLLHRSPGIPPKSVSANQLFSIGTIGGAKLLGLDTKIGSIEPEKEADLVLIDPQNILSPCMHPSISVYEAMIYKAKASDINTVLVKGKIVVKDRKILTVDEEEVIEKYSYYARKSWEDAEDEQEIVERMMPYLIKFFQNEEFSLPCNYQFNTK